MKDVDKIVELASKWWVEQILKPKFDVGDTDINGWFIQALAENAVADVDENTQLKFYDKLRKFIREKLDEKDVYDKNKYEYEFFKYSGLGSDYGPSKDLLDILNECNIPDKNVPWKTVMWISRNYLAVKNGYSANIEELYATPDYYRYEINSWKDSIKEYKNQERDDFYTEEYITRRIDDCKKEIKTLEKKLDARIEEV